MSSDEPVKQGTKTSRDDRPGGTLESDNRTEEVNLNQAEKDEEEKLRARYPQALRPGGSAFLQKRLNKGQKYFDSGDYNMAKAKGQKARPPAATFLPQQTTGDTIPTPDTLPTRKTSLVQSKLATGLS